MNGDVKLFIPASLSHLLKNLWMCFNNMMLGRHMRLNGSVNDAHAKTYVHDFKTWLRKEAFCMLVLYLRLPIHHNCIVVSVDESTRLITYLALQICPVVFPHIGRCLRFRGTEFISYTFFY